MKKYHWLRFTSAIWYVAILAVVNVILILLNQSIQSDGFLFLGNIITISFIFPGMTLYFERKEPFQWKRYSYFVGLTFVSLFIICQLFFYRFI